MPSQQEVHWSQLKVGVIVLVSAVILTTLLFLMTSSSGMSFGSHKITAVTYFENSSGVKSGAPVTLEGVTIGEVKSVTVATAPDRKLTPVMVVMKLDSKYQSSLHKDSTAAISSVGVLGDATIDINSQVAVGPPLQDGDELHTLETPSIQDVVKQSQGTIENLNVILAKMNAVVDNLQAGKGSVGQLINNPDLYNKANSTVDEFHKIAVNLNSNGNTVGKLLNDNAEMYNRLDDSLAKLQAITSDLQAGKGSAGMALKDEGLYKNLNSTLAHANSLITDIDAGKGSIGILAKDPAFAKKLTDTLAEANTLVTNINTGKGTLGKFATDDTAYTNLNKLLTESTSLVTTIRSDPKKYLTIHMKIF